MQLSRSICSTTLLGAFLIGQFALGADAALPIKKRDAGPEFQKPSYRPEQSLKKRASIDAVLPRLGKEHAGSFPARLKLAQILFHEYFTVRGFIVGGEEVPATDVRWQVGLVLTGYPPTSTFCGGSIMNERWILTAAHCVDDTAESQIMVYAGSHDLMGQGELIAIKHIKLHPWWRYQTFANDIALLELVSPVTLAEGMAETISIASALPGPGTPLHASGWGLTAEDKAGSVVLRSVAIPVVELSICNDSEHYDKDVLAGMFCAGVGDRDTCKGDSGGPVVDSLESRGRVQVGIVSWGDGCGVVNQPGVYTDVSTYSTWIREVMK